MNFNMEKPNNPTEFNQRTKTPIMPYVGLPLCFLLLCYPLLSDVVLAMKNTGGFLEGFVLFFAPTVLLPYLVLKQFVLLTHVQSGILATYISAYRFSGFHNVRKQICYV
jgi:hypothetical protein